MNYSALNNDFEFAIIRFHHISGAIFFDINMLVGLIIVWDSDSRGRKYRKYLFTLQFISTIFDACWGCYTPLLIVNCRLLYSNSVFANYLDIVTFTVIEFFLFGGVINAYFSCVYYRLNLVLPSDNHSMLRRIVLFFSLQFGVGIICGCGYLVLHEARSTDQEIPVFLCWITHKTSYLLLHETFLLYAFGTAACLWGFCMFCIIVAMIGRILKELKDGMQRASNATRMYQKRAIVSLVFQGTIPSLFYVLPVLVEALLYLLTLIQGLEQAAGDPLMSTASSIAFSLITVHTVAHSITIIACSPACRKTIRRIFACIFCLKTSVAPGRTRQSLRVSRVDYTRY